MASVAWSSGEQRGKGWHAGVPPTHQQLLYAWHLPLQCVCTARDFGKGWGPSWGHPWWGLQPWWLGLGKILAGGPTAAMIWGREGSNATVQGSSQGAAGWGGEGMWTVRWRLGPSASFYSFRPHSTQGPPDPQKLLLTPHWPWDLSKYP
jgi:hypothetical protein